VGVTLNGEITMAATLLQDTTYATPRSTSNRTIASRKAIWTGRVLSGIAMLFLAMDEVMKVAQAKVAVEGSAIYGFAPDQVVTIGIIGLVCLVLYLVPKTAPLGAVLWTGYFGGAIVTHLRQRDPLLTHVLFPIYVSALIWGGLYLRDPRVRALLGKR
jgi:hypothetical protein